MGEPGGVLNKEARTEAERIFGVPSAEAEDASTEAAGSQRLQTTEAAEEQRLQVAEAAGSQRLQTTEAAGSQRLQATEAARSQRLQGTEAADLQRLQTVEAAGPHDQADPNAEKSRKPFRPGKEIGGVKKERKISEEVVQELLKFRRSQFVFSAEFENLEDALS